MRKNNSHPGCLFLFAIPFAGVGVLMMWLTLDALVSWRSALGYTEVEAQILSVDLNSYSGDDSTTYEVTATYEYSYNGRELTGSRVGLFAGSDNIGDYHERIYQRLREAQQNHQRVPCYVNPKDPTEAYLDLEMRWGMIFFYLIFVIAFGGVGFGLMGFMGYQMVKGMRAGRLFAAVPIVIAAASKLIESKSTPSSAGDESAKATVPTAPSPSPSVESRVTRAKRSLVVQTSGGKKVLARILLAVIWNLIALPITWAMWPQFSEGDLITSMFLIVPGLGLLFALGAAVDLVHWKKFGMSTLSFREPPKTGQNWSCILTNNAVLRFDNGFAIQLKRPTKHKQKDEADLLAETEAYSQRDGDSGLYLPFQIFVPPSDNPHYLISISADIPGLDFRAEFKVNAET